MSKSMTPQRVRDNFVQNLAENAYLNMCTTEEMNIVISALEKQMPKKPLVIKNDEDIKLGSATWKAGVPIYKCHCCNGFIKRSDDFCPDCGQALDWSDEE